MAGATTNNRSCPLLSPPAAAADASGADNNPAAAKPLPTPSPTITPLELAILLIWLRAGCRILKSIQAKAGMIGSKRAKPRLSPAPSARSAICWAAKAASQELRVEKMAPAMAVEASVDGGLVKVVSGFGREMAGSFEDLGLAVNKVLGVADVDEEEILALIIAIVAIVVAPISY
jgi:hypothetical protein